MDRPSSRNSMKLNPLYDGSKVVAPAGFVNQYRGTVLFVMGSARSSKDNLLLIKYYYRRKPKLYQPYLPWIVPSVLKYSS